MPLSEKQVLELKCVGTPGAPVDQVVLKWPSAPDGAFFLARDQQVSGAHGGENGPFGSSGHFSEVPTTTCRTSTKCWPRSQPQDSGSKCRAQFYARRRIRQRCSSQRQSNDGSAGWSPTTSSHPAAPYSDAGRASQGYNVGSHCGRDSFCRRRGHVGGPDVQDDYDENDAGCDGQKSKKKNRRLPGLPATEASERSGEEEGEGWSSSSRGGKGIEAVEKLKLAMKAQPRGLPRENGAEDDEGNRSF